ncbi:MAG: flagellar hook-associated protein FlgK [Candidatus Accumulibacter sp.]|jgi:flagellar hook-associated protein 1 FlgK|nr:flagellar hook-associated protein FlgK [Accumulibacter sp.]
MGSGIFSIGVSALSNAQLGLATTGHNISNANTEGYNRQRIIQTSNIPTLTGAGYVGNGAYVSTIERIYNSFLAKQVASAQTAVSTLDAYAASLGELNNLLMDESAGLESALEGFFAGVNQVTADPASLTTRQTMVSGANNLVARFKSLSGQLDNQYQYINNQVQSFVGSINSYSQQISQINQQIINARAANGQPPNDLYDQRDQLIAELNKVVGVHTTTNTNGSLNVFFGNGQPLVVGTSTTVLAAVPASGDPSRLAVGITIKGSPPRELPESLISGGALAGVLQYRSEALDAASNSLGRIAASLALTFNAQHALGQDLLGRIDGDANFAANFFNIDTSLHVVADMNNPSGAATITASFLPAERSDDGTFYTNLTTSDYRLDYDGTNYTLTRLSDGETWSDTAIGASSPPTGLNALIQDQGFSLAESGAPVAGSSYLIEPTRNAAQTLAVNPDIVADVRQVAAAAPIFAQADTSNTGTATISAGSVAPGYSVTGLPVTLSYSGGGITFPAASSVTVTANGMPPATYPAGTPVPYTNGATYTFDGISFTLNGTLQNGDQFTIARNTNGVSDNRNALLLTQMQTGKTMAGTGTGAGETGTASFSNIYAQMVSDMGNKGAEVQTVLGAQETLLAEAQSARDSISGVNLDEEAVNLIQYQQAYQAAAKMLQIASDLFNSILQIR